MKLETTSLGYEYVRCRAGDTDDTCYIHRLTFVAEHGLDALDPGDEVHHRLPIPWLNVPSNLEAKPAVDHAHHHLHRADHAAPAPGEVIADGGQP
jgi:hypothetical protein